MMATNILPLLCAVFVASNAAAVNKDPATRDEDISNTTVNVTITHLDNGLYEYNYGLSSHAENKGLILSYQLDIVCADYPQKSPAQDFLSSGYGILASTDMHFTPVKLESPIDFPPHITINNKINWLVGLTPGGSIDGYRIVSPLPPAKRQYTLIPDWETRWWGYDEEHIPEEWPWIDNFIVTGLIDGPSCPSDKPPTYPGNGGEDEEISNLLVYSEPQRDRWHVGADVESLTLTIHYGENIDPKSFKAEPAWARSFFNPVPGGTDTVVLNLKKGKNLFKFSVSPTDDTVTNSKNKHYRTNVDTDVFEIRKEMKK